MRIVNAAVRLVVLVFVFVGAAITIGGPEANTQEDVLSAEKQKRTELKRSLTKTNRDVKPVAARAAG